MNNQDVLLEIIKALAYIAGAWLGIRGTDRFRRSKKGLQVSNEIINRYKDLAERERKDAERYRQKNSECEKRELDEEAHWQKMYNHLQNMYLDKENEVKRLNKKLK